MLYCQNLQRDVCASNTCICIYIYIYWLVVSTPLKNISQREGLSHILWKIKNVPNHQPVYNYIYICKHTYLHVWTTFEYLAYLRHEPRLTTYRDPCFESSSTRDPSIHRHLSSPPAKNSNPEYIEVFLVESPAQRLGGCLEAAWCISFNPVAP